MVLTEVYFLRFDVDGIYFHNYESMYIAEQCSELSGRGWFRPGSSRVLWF